MASNLLAMACKLAMASNLIAMAIHQFIPTPPKLNPSNQVGSGYSEGDPGYVERYSFVVDDLQKRAEEERPRLS